jgi:hypothetical protein
MRRIYWGFCRNWFLIDPLHYLLSCSDFCFEFAEIFIIEKQLPDLASLGVGDSPSPRVIKSSSYRSSKGSSSNTFKCGLDRMGPLGKPPASLALLPSRASSCTRSNPALLAPPCRYEAIRVWSYTTFIVNKAVVNRKLAVET